MKCLLGVVVVLTGIGCSNDQKPRSIAEAIPKTNRNRPEASTRKDADTRETTKADVNDTRDLIPPIRESLEAYLKKCNSRIEMVESQFSKKRPVKLTPGDIDIKKTDSVVHPYNGMLTILIATGGNDGPPKRFEYHFTLKPSGNSGWEYVSCYGGPTSGKLSEWTLHELALQYQGRIGMAWLLGYDESKTLLDSHKSR